MHPCAGILLVANPRLTEPNFARSVVFLLEHGEHGTLGFIINRPRIGPLSEIWEKAPSGLAGCIAAAEGGPVEPDKGLLVHASPTILGAQEMALGCAVGGDLEAIAERYRDGCDLTGPRLFLGHSGWEQGQLEHEVQQGAWILRQGVRDLLLDNAPPAGLWEMLVAGRLGGLPDPSLN
jgi:putative transcriptional regulator